MYRTIGIGSQSSSMIRMSSEGVPIDEDKDEEQGHRLREAVETEGAVSVVFVFFCGSWNKRKGI